MTFCRSRSKINVHGNHQEYSFKDKPNGFHQKMQIERAIKLPPRNWDLLYLKYDKLDDILDILDFSKKSNITTFYFFKK